MMTRTRAREEGREAALKLAGFVGDALHTTKNFMIGEPTRFARELHAGTAWKPGGSLRETFVPRTLTGAAMTYALPLGMSALMMHGAPQEQKGEGWGGIAGGTLGGMLMAPLGFVGQSIGNIAGSTIGGRLGSKYDEARGG